jgi:hypothetical protein
MAKAEFNKKKALFASKMDLELRKKLVKWYIWSLALYGAETWTLRAVDQKHPESFEMWCWKRMEKISWTGHVRNITQKKVQIIRLKDEIKFLHVKKEKRNNQFI